MMDKQKSEESQIQAKKAWQQAFEKLLDSFDVKDSEEALNNLKDFLEGDATYAEVQGIPQQMLFDIAEQAYLKFKSGRLEQAQKVFHALSLVDHRTAYYHTALGAIYQKQEKYLDALAEYTAAIELDPGDITAYTNRGEIYYLLGQEEEPLRDFDAAIALDKTGKDAWANRAKFLKKQLLEYIAELDAAEKEQKN